MKITLSNNGVHPVPVTGEGWGIVLYPGASQVLDYPDKVWIAGDKAGILENIGKSIKTIADFLLQRKKPKPGEMISVTMTNSGAHSIRVVPGNVQNESEVTPGGVSTLTGTDYIEFRELG